MRAFCLLASAAVTALCLLTTGAYAQDDDEIVVTATRAPARIKTLPAEVDVIDVNAAQERGLATLADALRAAPGLDVVQSGGAGQQTSLFAGGANSNHTLVLFDGLRINDPSTPGSSFDAGEDLLGGLARIEVVQGPMSAVFGSDAIGGVINLIPRHGGPAPFSARLDAVGGSLNTWRGQASADGALGGFRYALSGEGFRTDGYDLVPRRMSSYTGEKDGAWMTGATGVFDYRTSDALSFDLLLRQRRAHADFDPFPFDFATFNSFRAEDDTLEISRNDLSLGRLGATWAISDGLSLRATYGGLKQRRVQSDHHVPTDFYTGDRRFGDVTLTWSPSADASVVAGAASERESVDIAEGFGFSPPVSFVRADEDHAGVFLAAQTSFERATLTGALRADEYDGFGAHTTWRVGVSYNVIEAARLYAAYGTSFRAPTLYERYVSFGDPNLDPEAAKSWEIGADAQLRAFGRERGVELSALYRHSDIDDLIDFGPLFTYANVDRAAIDAAEARLGVRPFDWLNARIAYVWTDARNELTHTQLLRRPKNYWTAELTATRGPFRADFSWREIGERLDQIYGDDGFSEGVGRTPSYNVARLSLAYEASRNAEIYLSADNLFDETYEPVNAFAGAPRTIDIGLRARY